MTPADSIGWTIILLIFLLFFWWMAKAFSYNNNSPFHGYSKSPDGTLGIEDNRMKSMISKELITGTLPPTPKRPPRT